jgi:hypothetical protein
MSCGTTTRAANAAIHSLAPEMFTINGMFEEPAVFRGGSFAYPSSIYHHQQ